MDLFEFEFDPLQIFQDFIFGLLQPFFDFILSFLPNGDQAIYSLIDSFGNVGGLLTFNVFWFVEWDYVLTCLAVVVSIILVSHVLKFLMHAIKLVSTAIETVPIVE